MALESNRKNASGKAKGQQRQALLSPAEKQEFRKYMYPFENLAFEGGGCKGVAYVGVIRALEEVGIYRNMRRFAGTSCGSVGAMLAAIGCNSYEIEDIMSINLEKTLCDASLGKAGFPMLMWRFGLHPGKRFLKWIGDIVARKLGNPDATFADLYNQTGRELCVVVVNINQLDCEYCHVKTTPNMPIRIAVRMSSSIPGLVAPVKYKLHGLESFFCDGGLVCNYPIHAFDGWFLSMDEEHSFLKRMPVLGDIAEYWDTSSRFGTEANKDTIGILLYSETEQEMFKQQLNERADKYVDNPALLQDTKLARQYRKIKKEKMDAAAEHEDLSKAMLLFMKLLQDADVDSSGTINRAELTSALENAEPDFGKVQRVHLFGRDLSPDELFDSMDEDKNGEITMNEILSFAEERGVKLRQTFRGFESRTIKKLSHFFDGVLETMLLNMKKIFLRGSDIYRTVGVNTVYLDTMDFKMEPGDREFLLEKGKDACIAFLRYHIDAQEIQLKEANANKTDKELNRNSKGFYEAFQAAPESRKVSAAMSGIFIEPVKKGASSDEKKSSTSTKTDEKQVNGNTVAHHPSPPPSVTNEIDTISEGSTESEDTRF